MNLNKLGVYYHVNATVRGNQIYTEPFIGLFLEGLAMYADVTYFCSEENDNKDFSHLIDHPNIKVVFIGPAATAYHRIFFPGKFVNTIINNCSDIDAFLIRAPTPLAPSLYNALRKNRIKAFFMLVGDYMDGIKYMEQPFVRKKAIQFLLRWYQYLQNKAIKNTTLLVNSYELLQKNLAHTKNIELIKTTTLTDNDFFERDNNIRDKDEVSLLYAGRINYSKGLRELVSALATLKKRGIHCILNIVGWEEKSSFSYEENLKQLAQQSGVEAQLVFHGKKKTGPELNSFYRRSDIFVIPSYHEGFPRVIWESMANSLPVIATRVGGIPHYLADHENCLLIEPKNSDAIANAIEELIKTPELADKITKNAFAVANEVTQAKQCRRIIDMINGHEK